MAMIDPNGIMPLRSVQRRLYMLINIKEFRRVK